MNIREEALAALAVAFWHFQGAAGMRLRSPGMPGPIRPWIDKELLDCEKRGWCVSDRKQGKAIIRLNARLEKALGYPRLPGPSWNYSWDGQWRWLLFDLPSREKTMRHRLWRFLKHYGFGCIQHSVWITPFETGHFSNSALELASYGRKLLLISGAPEIRVDFDPVRDAWNWGKIRERYDHYEKHLDEFESMEPPDDPDQLRHLIWSETLLWNEASFNDPFLPRKLWPSNYPGERLWKRRLKLAQQWFTSPK